nr:MAG TPA: hypothetical protein [Caudoviricetes sp.]
MSPLNSLNCWELLIGNAKDNQQPSREIGRFND